MCPSKVSRIKNPYYVMYPYNTSDKNLRMIQSFVQELWHFLCFRFWPPGGQADQIGLCQPSIEEKKWVINIEKYVENKLHIK
jgi:hypothetical protein